MPIVTLEPGGERFESLPGERVLDAALRHGITLPHECRNGSCGTCRALCLGGTVHLPANGIEQEISGKQEVLTCKAVATSNLLLRCAPVEARYLPRKLPARVQRLEFPAKNVARLFLQLGTGQSMAFRPGHYAKLSLSNGIRRSYSIAAAGAGADSRTSTIELHIKRVDGGRFSSHVFEHLKVRDVVRIEGPYGNFFLRPDDNGPSIFLATGTGFAPVKAMLEQMHLLSDRRNAHFYWGARRFEDLYLHEWMTSYVAQLSTVKYVPVLSREMQWKGRRGWVPEAALADCADVQRASVYACGSPAMVDHAKRIFVDAGMHPNRFYADPFVSHNQPSDAGSAPSMEDARR